MRGCELSTVYSADYTLGCGVNPSEPAVKHQIAESMLDLLQAVPELLPEPQQRACHAMSNLDYCSRALDKLQRRRACELLTRLLQENDVIER